MHVEVVWQDGSSLMAIRSLVDGRGRLGDFENVYKCAEAGVCGEKKQEADRGEERKEREGETGREEKRAPWRRYWGRKRASRGRGETGEEETWQRGVEEEPGDCRTRARYMRAC